MDEIGGDTRAPVGEDEPGDTTGGPEARRVVLARLHIAAEAPDVRLVAHLREGDPRIDAEEIAKVPARIDHFGEFPARQHLPRLRGKVGAGLFPCRTRRTA